MLMSSNELSKHHFTTSALDTPKDSNKNKDYYNNKLILMNLDSFPNNCCWENCIIQGSH